MADIIGRSVGRYHIIEKLGEGGMAIVYKAYDTHLECEVALKIIRTDQLAPSLLERALKRFEREAKAVARLSHPNIVKVSDYGEFEGQPYLVMPYLRGGTLKSLLSERGKIPWQEAAQLLLPIANALSYAHECGVIHRDIKPSNILLTEKGEPMLTDFGVAKIVGDEVTQDLTGTSATVGTPEYMAPEQVTSKSVDHRADIYGLGVVYYEMITGRRPFEADTPLAVLFKHASDPLPRPSLYTKELPVAVENVLIKALMKKPEDRYQTMKDVSSAFRSLIEQKTVEPQRRYSQNAGIDGLKNQEQADAGPERTQLVGIRKQLLGTKQLKTILISTGLISALVFLLILIISKSSGVLSLIENAKDIATESPIAQVENTNQQIDISPTAIPSMVAFTPSPTTNVNSVIIGNSNCRYGPGSDYSIIKVLDSGSNVTILGINHDKSWVMVEIHDESSSESPKTCWVTASQLDSDGNFSIPEISDYPQLFDTWNLHFTVYRKFGNYVQSEEFQIINFTSTDRINEILNEYCNVSISGTAWQAIKCEKTISGPLKSDLTNGVEVEMKHLVTQCFEACKFP